MGHVRQLLECVEFPGAAPTSLPLYSPHSSAVTFSLRLTPTPALPPQHSPTRSWDFQPRVSPFSICSGSLFLLTLRLRSQSCSLPQCLASPNLCPSSCSGPVHTPSYWLVLSPQIHLLPDSVTTVFPEPAPGMGLHDSSLSFRQKHQSDLCSALWLRELFLTM